ncbi:MULTISPECIES: hypothetical protein [unclassified Microcoleus]|uniref:hypothetical protein n=1 Tax=unclassified Microcoleus TaxID=2642155 RepID=UPI002FD312C8
MKLKDLKEAIGNASNPQAMKGKNWGSGDARTFRFNGASAIEAINNAHWQDCVWFRASPESEWIKASGLVPYSAEEVQQDPSKKRYFWTQEKLTKVYLEVK